MNKRFLLILLVFVIGFFGILVATKKKDNAPNSSGNNTAQLSNHVIGAGKKGVTLTEYGDFACPACYQYFPIVEQVRQKYGDDIKFQFRNFPLVEIHQNALVGARAAEAASLQGKFWDMYELLYQHQPEWRDSQTPTKFFEDYAAQIGLNIEKFREDSKSDAVNAAVQADRADALKQGFSGTPTFLINGKRIESPHSLEDFEKVIDNAIAAKKQ